MVSVECGRRGVPRSEASTDKTGRCGRACALQADWPVPENDGDLPPGVLDQLAAVTRSDAGDLNGWLRSSRTSRRYRAEILEFLGIRRLTQRDLAAASAFAAEDLCPQGLTPRLIPLTQVPTISSGCARTRLRASHHIWG